MTKLIITMLFIPLIGMAQNNPQSTSKSMNSNTSELQEATFGAGCFWCVEAVFEQLKGVHSVEAGYAGGHLENPTYKEVTTGKTGHAEVAHLTYDPSVISYDQLLTVFWHTHNPTTKNRQGADVGPQYRSVIFYHNDQQRKLAKKSLKETDKSDLWEDPIVTEIEEISNYSKAEDYHQNYYENNKNKPYCSIVIAPKLKKLKKEFGHLLADKVSQK